MKGFVLKEKGKRIDSISNHGILTGVFETNLHGCWWELIQDNNHKKVRVKGEYPKVNDIDLPF